VLIFGGILALPMTFAAAEASYRFIERPIVRRFRARLAARQQDGFDAIGVESGGWAKTGPTALAGAET
jgi:peptidoglycan/LPS O-acetylase OafA/YrhL